MRLKAIRDLTQLTDAGFFSELHEGLGLCHANAKRIFDDAAVLTAQKRHRAAKMLQTVADEEAAKILILIDAVRCPRSESQLLTRQLAYFSDHLAKGLYAQACERRPCAFGEVRAWVERERKELYLDGPNGVDWIFYNDILTRREQAMYVDYVAAEGNHWWHDPLIHEPLSGFDVMPSAVFRLVDAMAEAGFFATAALATIAEVWRGVAMDDSFSIHDLRAMNRVTLEKLEAKGLLLSVNSAGLGLIFSEWLFPLFALHLRVEEIPKADLEADRANFSPWL